MVIVNIAGDLIVLSAGGTVAGVAVVTIAMTGVGIVIGWVAVRRSVRLTPAGFASVLHRLSGRAHVRLTADRG